MKSAALLAVSLLVFSAPIFAQISPRPVADQELRDNNSIRMRSMQLEKFKRDQKQAVLPQFSKEVALKIGEIKEDFEGIQLLQDRIVRTYTTGKTIKYGKIADSAAEMSKKATRLDQNLFGAAPGDDRAVPADPANAGKTVRQLIIELDAAIGSFVSSPVFESDKVVDSKVAQKAELDLRRIVALSASLADASRRARKS